jgi:hypothetical protein
MGLTRPRAYQIFDIDYKQSVRVVTVSNVTLSGGAPAQVDGVSLSQNDRVLVTGQSTGSQNGLYYVTTVGSGSNGTWARSVDGNETGEIEAGMIVMVTEGTAYADTQWKLTTNNPIVIGTTALTFVLNVQANSISSGTSNVVVNSNSNVAISVAGTANVLTVSADQITVSANIIPTANITYDLGSLTNQWRDIYVGPGSLYINGSKVLEESAGAILVTADVDQGVTVKTTGTGVSTVQSSSAVNITGTGSADITLTTGASGQIEFDGNVTINSSKTINSSDAGPITFGDGISLSNNDISNVSTLTATGNITTSGYLFGNGSQLTGIGGGTSIANGTSNVAIPTSAGNVSVAVAGYANTAVFGVNTLALAGPFSTPKYFNSVAQVAANVNAILISPCTIGDSGNISIPDNSTLTIFTPT